MLGSALKSLGKFVLVAGVIAGGTAGVWVYERRQSASWQIQQLERQRLKLEEEKRELQTVVTRLSDEKRVAEVLVTEQKQVGETLRTTLLFVEYGRDGVALKPKTFTIEGNTAHIDAMVIKFDRDFVGRNDPLRGHSIALFRRLFGEAQSPEKAWRIDEPGEVPEVYKGKSSADGARSAQSAAFEKDLWQNFWRLADDKDYRTEKGVRVANGQGIWGPFSPDKLYTITLDADGGLNVSSEPLKGIYREAMKARFAEKQ